MKIGCEETISIAHQIPGHPKCGQLHGHNLRIVVEIEGTLALDGMTVDFGVVKAEIMKYDHSNLNDTMLDNPTAERLAARLAYAIAELAENIKKVKVRVYETDKHWAEDEVVTKV